MICAPLADQEAVEPLVAEIVRLIHEAGNPYLDWFFGGPEPARAALARWVHRPSSEYAIGRVRALLDGEVLAGAYVGLGGAELARCRKADAVAAFKEAGVEGRAALGERLAERRGLFPPVGDDEFYLSNIGVIASHRGKGLGRRLLDEYIAEGRAKGYGRFRLDVDATNAPARRLYESRGFRVVHEHETAEGRLSYCSLVLDEGGAA